MAAKYDVQNKNMRDSRTKEFPSDCLWEIKKESEPGCAQRGKQGRKETDWGDEDEGGQKRERQSRHGCAQLYYLQGADKQFCVYRRQPSAELETDAGSTKLGVPVEVEPARIHTVKSQM